MGNKSSNEATMNNEMKSDDTLGVTLIRKHEIWLVDNNVDMIRTLKHELTHAWLWEYGHNQHEKEFNAEDICEIVASSNDFINEVAGQYTQDKQICHVENKNWEELSDYQKELILNKIKGQPLQITQT